MNDKMTFEEIQFLKDLLDEEKKYFKEYNLKSVGKWKVMFGKYQFMTYQDLLKKDPGYLKWMSENEIFNDRLKDWYDTKNNIKELSKLIDLSLKYSE